METLNKDLTPYPAYKDSAIPWLGQIPAHWEVNKFKYLFAERVQKGYPDEPLLAATQTKGVVRKEEYENRTVLALKDLHLLKLVREADFVISLRSFQGGIEYARHQGIISPAYTVLYTLDPANQPYYALLFKSKPFVDNLTLFVTGIRQGQNIDYGSLRTSLLPLPPPDEQAAIARYLDAVDRRIRRYIRAKQKLIKLLEEQKQAIIHQAVTRGPDPNVPLKDSGVEWLGQVPAHWEVMRFKYLVETNVTGIQMGPFGASLKEIESSPTGYKLYGQENTISGDFSRGTRWLSKTKFDSLRKYELLPGDMVLTRKGSIGQARIVPNGIETGIADSDTIRVKINRHRLNPEFAQLVLHQSYYMNQQTVAKSRGAVLTGLNSDTIANLLFAIPSIAEQEQILAAINHVLICFGEATSKVIKEIDLIREYRTRLIADVVTGLVDVRRAAASWAVGDVAGEEGVLDEGWADDEAEDEMDDAVLEGEE